MASSREAAVRSLIRCQKGGYSQLVLDAELARAKLQEQDAAFAAALFYGTLERALTLDHCIAKYARHALDGEVQAVLRTAFYQLLYLDSVPPHAAVNEAVELTRVLRRAAASRMVNGVLHAFLRDGCRIPPVSGTAARLRVQYSCGDEIIKRLIGWYGEARAEEILAASLGRPPIFIRVNTLKTNADSLISRLAAEGCEAAFGPFENCLTASGDLAHTKAHQEGLFHIQDAASQRAAIVLAAKPGERVLDVCAAPGSKSFVLAQQMQNAGELISCDLSEKRLQLVERNAARLGISVLRTRPNDGTVPAPELGSFDAILCDVPCSGLGVLRRKPELKYREAGAIDSLPAVQYKILEISSHYCRAGGRMVYSTCTVNPEENERIVECFLREHPDFVPDPFEGERYCVTNLPGEGGADGFFIAGIRRK